MKFAKRDFGEFEMIRQQLGHSERRLGNAAARMIVSLPDHMIQLMRHQSGDSAGVHSFLYNSRFSPQRRAEERIQRRAVDIAKWKDHPVRNRTRGERERSVDGVFETNARFGGMARASQANQRGVVVFRSTAIKRGVLPFHMNRCRLQKMAQFPLHLRGSHRRDGRIRCEKDDQGLLTRRERLRTANAQAHAERAGEGEDVCNTRHSNHSVVQKI